MRCRPNSKNSLRSSLVKIFVLSVVMAAVLVTSACTPTVKVEAPDKPIVINMNINISHEIRVKIDKDLDHAMKKKSSIF